MVINTYVKYENGGLWVTNLNKALQAKTVYLSEAKEKVFEAYLKDQPNKLKHYQYVKQGLKELNE